MSADFKPTLWKAADKLRAQMDAAEYKHFLLGLSVQKYIFNAFLGGSFVGYWHECR